MKQAQHLRRYLTSLLLLAVTTLTWAYSFALNGIYYNKNTDGTSVSVTYKDYNTYKNTVVIPSSVTIDGKTYNVTGIDYHAFYGSAVTYVKIPNSIIRIADRAFQSCDYLTKVEFASIESLCKINFESNESCNPLSLSKVSHLYINGQEITDLVIPESVTNIGNYAFSGCSGLTSITIPGSVTSIGIGAFSYCKGLTSITIPNSVTTIGDKAFWGCRGLTSVTIPESVTNIGSYAFSFCEGLTKAEFASIESLCKIYFNNYDSNPLCYAKHLYINGQEVTDVVIPNSIKSINPYAFSGCSGLTKVTINSNNVVSKTYTSSSNLSTIFGSQVKEYILGDNITAIGDYAFYNYSGLTSIIIPENVTSIGSRAFSGCSGLTSVSIPNNVINIGDWAFSGCSSLTKVTINSNNVVSKTYTSSSNLSTIFGSQVKEYILGDNITAIGDYAFYNYSGLTSIIIPENVTSIGNYAFSGCSGLTKAEFASIESLCKIKFSNYVSNPLYYAKHLYIDGQEVTDVVIPNSITSINAYTFYYCSSLKSVTIPNSVTTIGDDAFYGCTGLTKVTINSNDVVSKTYTSSSNLSTIFGSQVKEYILGDNITAIGDRAFYGCTGLSSVICHAQKVPSAGSYVFYNVPSTATLYVPAESINAYKSASQWSGFRTIRAIGEVEDFSVDGIYYHTNPGVNTAYVTYKDKDYNSYSGAVVIPSTVAYGDKTYDVTGIGSSAFKNSRGLTSVTIGSGVTSIDSYAFDGCSSLTSVTIPESVTSIDWYAFNGCYNLTNVTLPDKLSYIGPHAFPSNTKIYVNKGVPAMFAAWRYGIAPYEVSTNTSLASPTLSVSSTQTTATVTVSPVHSGLTYKIDSKYNITSKSNRVKYTDFRPDETRTVILVVSAGGDSYTVSKSVTTKALNPSVSLAGSSASSVRVQGGRTAGDAEIISESFTVNGVTKTGHTANFTGLTPDRKYSVEYKALVKYGTSGEKTYLYTAEGEVSTSALTLTTSQPKVISAGNVIVEAVSNLDDEEENVGFEWRRTDYTDDFASNKGTAYLYEGVMEGYIRNLNTEKLWKVRPYYQSGNGTYYYGQWIGLDPTNTSYFEPTVHTYAKINVTGNKALVSGYVQRGSDAVRKQGFKYWVSESGARVAADAGMDSRALAASAVPSGAITVEADGRIMEAELSDLSYSTTYSYVAFVTTTEGETFYGKQLTFTTEDAPTGIDTLQADEAEDTATQTVSHDDTAIYDLHGRRLHEKPARGFYIQSGKKYFVK